MPKDITSCLIISYGPVPTPDYQTIEGGGMRAWGLAKGLLTNGVETTVAVNASFEQKRASHEGIKLVNWQLDDEFKRMINSYDAVIISYCMGDPSVFVADYINDDTTLILDCYVPIFVEVSAREAKDMKNELRNYFSDMKRHNHTLKRGDYFLCANKPQELFYTGVLSALGIINPRSYKDDRLLICPFGIHDEPLKITENPYAALGAEKDEFVVLWFGGLYPWFRVDELLEAIESLTKKHDNVTFVFVGGKNPYNPNPDFQRQYDKAVSFAQKTKLIGKRVHFVDWVDYNTRVNWYHYADLVISLNNTGEENKLSWRTRVMDFIWGEVAMVTNGGDPLSDELIAAGASLKLDSLSAKSIESAIIDAYANPERLMKLKSQIKKVKSSYYWRVITKVLAEKIINGDAYYVDERNFKQSSGAQSDDVNIPAPLTTQPGNKVGKLAKLPIKAVRSVRSKGLKKTANVAVEITQTQAKKYLSPSKSEQNFVFIAHPMDMTGAPLVLMDIMQEVAEKYGAHRVHLVTPSMTPDAQRVISSLGIRTSKAVHGMGFRFVRAQLGLRPHDFVFLNTIAIYDNYRDFVMLWLKTGRLEHAHWFIHEDTAQIGNVSPSFIDAPNIKRITNRIKSDKLTVYTPSNQTKRQYDELFSTSKVVSVPLKVHVQKKYIRKRPASDYETIRFLLSGTPSDGRKAQLLALSALQDFYLRHYSKNPKNYRDFELHLVAIGDDYVSKQIRSVAKNFDGRVVIHPSLPKEEAMDITSNCNAVICLSLNETFGLYIAEGMLMGHVVLRNDSAGVDEQLEDGVNGYALDNDDLAQISQAFAKVLTRKITNNELKAMGDASYDKALPWTKNTFLKKFDIDD